MGLALKGKAECNKKHQREGEIFQIAHHSYSLGGSRLHGTTLLWIEDATDGEKFRFVVFLMSLFCPNWDSVNLDVRID